MRSLAVLLAAGLLAGCAAQRVVPNADGRSARCAEQARAAVPSAWTIVEEEAEKSPYPTLTKVQAALMLYSPGGLGLGWLVIHEAKQRRYEAAFDNCMIHGPTADARPEAVEE